MHVCKETSLCIAKVERGLCAIVVFEVGLWIDVSWAHTGCKHRPIGRTCPFFSDSACSGSQEGERFKR